METCPIKSRILSKSQDNIRDLLGHISIQTTEIYARADSKTKRETIEAAYQPSIPEMDVTEKIWEKDKKILEFLKGLA